MKEFLTSILFVVWTFCLNAQSPDLFKYQSVARDISGTVIADSPIGLRISIRDLTETGALVYQEEHVVITNGFGLFNLNVGGGVPILGTFQSVNWPSGAKFIEIEADLTGGNSYEAFGISQLLSVPYALFANNAENSILPAGTAAGNTSFWNGTAWVVDDANLYNEGENIGVGTNTPLQKFDVNGNINISLDSSYMIDNRRILWITNDNIFIGDNTGGNTTLANNNTFLGMNSGPITNVGSQNVFVGNESGFVNTTGELGTFIGRRAGYTNSIGIENTFIGAYAGQFNTSGGHNSFLGVTAGNLNDSGEENSFLGAHAGYSNTSGSFNTFVGNFSGVNNTIGNRNTLLGFEAEVGSAGITNAMALGNTAVVSSSNSVVIGNSNIISIGGQVGWSTLSDARLKENIHKNNLGLTFINSLETVTYNYKKTENKQRYSGLIAQDVETLLDEMGSDFSGIVKPENNSSYYTIRYAEFVIPLIKAVQEQSEVIEQLNDRIEDLEKTLELLIEQQN